MLSDIFYEYDPKNIKVKLNVWPADTKTPAWDLLKHDDDMWMKMNEWRTKQPNNNLDKVE